MFPVIVSFLLSFDDMFYVGNDAIRSYFWTHAEHNQNVLSSCRIIQQLVNGIIAPTAVPNIGVGPWWVQLSTFQYLGTMTNCFYVKLCRGFLLTLCITADFCFFIYRGVLHSNPMDYAWGANGLDAIITQVRIDCLPLTLFKFLNLKICLHICIVKMVAFGQQDLRSMK